MQVKDSNRPISFKNAHELRSLIETLPSPPRWVSTEIVIEGGTTSKPLILFHRDGLECYKFQTGNPVFRDKQEFTPRKEWADEMEESQLFDDPFTGDLPWDIQV